MLKTEFIPTSKGLKYVILLTPAGMSEHVSYINLSWVHSAQELEKNKILILYYSMQKLKQEGEKPTIDSLVI